MKNKAITIALVAIIIAFAGIVVVGKVTRPPEPPRPGIEHDDRGRKHTETTKYDGDHPPTSGAHADPVAWGKYSTELRDDQVLHDLEHGGIYVSYAPTLPEEQVQQLAELLFAPFSNKEFQPKKIVLAPRAANKSPIEVSSWLRSETMTSFDAKKIESYVKRNTGESPEPNTP